MDLCVARMITSFKSPAADSDDWLTLNTTDLLSDYINR